MRKYDIPEVRLYTHFIVCSLWKSCLLPAGGEGARRRQTCSVKSCHERPKSLLMARLPTTFPSKTNSRESSRKWMAEDTTLNVENNTLRQETAPNDAVRQRYVDKNNKIIERTKKKW